MSKKKDLDRYLDRYYDFLKQKTPISTCEETGWTLLSTPFTGLFNDNIGVYIIKKKNGEIHFSDDADTYNGHHTSNSYKLSQKDIIENTPNPNVAMMFKFQKGTNEITTVARTDEDFEEVMHSFVSLLQSLNEKNKNIVKDLTDTYDPNTPYQNE